MNTIENFLRSKPGVATILYFSTLAYIIYTIYSDYIAEDPRTDLSDFPNTLVFFLFLYLTYIAIMIQKDKKDKKKNL
ncbi:MAG: hypothetical protein P8M03_05640 [Flavobacteriaceae bacterium]|nr:hypothetical protein [Flavobacteriaceae bacterium]